MKLSLLRVCVLITAYVSAESSEDRKLHEFLLSKATRVNFAENDRNELRYIENKSNRNLYWWNFGGSSSGSDTSSSGGSTSSSGGSSTNVDDTDDEPQFKYDDDFYLLENKYSFKGYSLQYAKCAKVQRFSPNAVQKGEYSSMVTDDLVILRLCPKSSCNSSSKYGCSSGYGEYAIDLNEYMKAIVKYEHEKEQSFCEFCDACSNGSSSNSKSYKNDDDSFYNGDDGNRRHRDLSSTFQSKDGSTRLYDSSSCSNYSSKCKSTCNNYYSSTGQYKNYLNYIGCQKVKAQGGSYYWVSASCDTDYNTVTLGVYYDNKCEVESSESISYSNLVSSDFDMDIFQSIPKVGCLDCRESKYPPYYSSNNLLCNNIYQSSGRCDSMVNIGSQYYYDADNSTSSSSEESATCGFIESVMNGAYDRNGEIYLSSSQTSASAPVTTGQKVTLAILTLTSFGLGIFACFLHHRMNNLLLKSLSTGFIGSKKRWDRHRRKNYDDSSIGGSTATGSLV